jgi:hypothetical protein
LDWHALQASILKGVGMTSKHLILSAVGAAAILWAAVPGFAVTVPVPVSATADTGWTILIGPALGGADLRLSPGTWMTGFGPAADSDTLASGAMSEMDGVVQPGQANLTKAYDALSSMALSKNSTGHYHARDLGALVPGVYHFESSDAIAETPGLGAQDTDGVYWVFAIPTELAAGANNRVVKLFTADDLRNTGADIGVFWTVGNSATLGASTTLDGNALALPLAAFVPEPLTLCGLALGLGTLGRYVRRRARR